VIRFLGTLLALLLLPLAAAAAPVLKPLVTVDDKVIRLGDLFDGLGARAGTAVAAAPPPGSKIVFDSNWLAALAEGQHVDWHPASRFDQAVVERASRTIGAEEIAETLLRALAEQTPTAGAEIKLDDPTLRLVAAAGDRAPPALDGLTFDRRSGRFSAFLGAAGSEPGAQRLRVSGRLLRNAEVPTLTRPIAAGETIAAGDVTLVSVRADRLGPDALLQTADIVGKAARHTLRAGEPLRQSDVETPVVVHRGSIVTIVLDSDTLHLTAEGKAIEDGSMGAAIRIANTKSNRVIDAVVTGPGTVAVRLASR